MLTAEEMQILATSLGVAGRAVLFSLPVAIILVLNNRILSRVSCWMERSPAISTNLWMAAR